jgi:hypothetical protein
LRATTNFPVPSFARVSPVLNGAGAIGGLARTWPVGGEVVGGGDVGAGDVTLLVVVAVESLLTNLRMSCLSCL